MKIIQGIGLLGLMVVAGCSTPAPEEQLPPELLYKGKPIPPICMENAAHTDGWLTKPRNITDCIKYEQEQIKIKPAGADSGLKDMIGYAYTVPKFPSMNTPYSYYRFVGKIKTGLVVYSLNSGGGSGHFSSLDVFRRKGDIIQVVKQVRSGDRCNGGVSDVKLDGDDISYSENITPYDFFRLGQYETPIKATKDVESSATSCFAKARYKGAELVSVTLEPKAGVDSKGWTDKYTYQPCFNRVFRSYLEAGKTTLSQSQLEAFVTEFYAQCYKAE